MSEQLNPIAPHHLPPFITLPGETDVLMNLMIVFLIILVLIIGVLYLRLHALPEHIAHRSGVVQFQVVSVLALIALFTHNNIYWVLALLLALIRIPDFSTPLIRIADALEAKAAKETGESKPEESAETTASKEGEVSDV